MGQNNETSIVEPGASPENALATIPPHGRSLQSKPCWRTLAKCSNEDARALLPYHYAKHSLILPLTIQFAHDTRQLIVAAGEELSEFERRSLEKLIGLELIVEPFDREGLQHALELAYHTGESSFKELMNDVQVSSSSALGHQHDIAPLDDNRPIPLLLDSILMLGIKHNASDIHFEPLVDEVRVRFRIDGLLRDGLLTPLPQSCAAQIFRRIKVLSKLDITSNQSAQDGAFSFASSSHDFRIRVSFLPQLPLEKLVLRIHDDKPLELATSVADLGLTPKQERVFLHHLQLNSGAIILAGPTGSGKTTLLYTALSLLNTEWRNIVTLEDPVERRILGTTQISISRNQGAGFSEMLPAILRQDPDVIMLGEIRESKAAETALAAALTGHLVLTTIHADNALGVFQRLQQLQVDQNLVSAGVKLVVAQRLIPLNCVACRTQAIADPSVVKLFRLEEELVGISAGCAVCNFTGISGRTGVFELLAIGDALHKAISRGMHTDFEHISALAWRSGFEPFPFRVRELLMAHRISPTMAIRALGFMSLNMENIPPLSPAFGWCKL